MSYQVLARKWRPQNFTEMVGQEHVLRALVNALDSDRLHHAYLFTGTRGVGKTTIARILAKCLNCETGVTSKPCGTCSSCTEIVAGNFVDLIEVDAASRTKVEDTRELLENVQYAPTRARFKVYLIDEVHMLTGHSFNALLKTLEEPPPHVKFLFATTDPQKLPATILSRCLQFNLKRMPMDLIIGHLTFLLKKESIEFEEPALKLIARAADGSMRDALSLLDQAIAFSGQNITETAIKDMLGTVSHEPLLDLLRAISNNDGAKLLQLVEDLSSITPDFEAASDALIEVLHNIAVQQVVPNAIDANEDLQSMATQLSKEDVQLYYQIALQGRKDIPLSPDPRSGFEMLLLRMLSFRPLQQGMQIAAEDQSLDENKKKTVKTDKPELNKGLGIESATDSNKIIKAKVAPEEKKPTSNTPPPWEDLPPAYSSASDSRTKTQTENTPDINQLPASVKDERDNNEIKARKNLPWHDVVTQLNVSGRSAELIKHCVLASQDDAMISLVLNKGHEYLLADTTQQEIETAIQSFYGLNKHLSISLAALEDSSDSPVNIDNENQNKIAERETPSQRNIRVENEVQQQAEKNIASDPFVIELENRFNAQVVPGSVQPKR